MVQSEEIGELITALAKALPLIDTVSKDNKGNYGKYATVGAVLTAIKDALLTHGIVVTQFYEQSDLDSMAMTTQISHTSGQWMRGTALIPLAKKDAQGYGSASTYCRRYSLVALLGIVTDDDDGQAASNAASRQTNQPKAEVAPRGATAPQQYCNESNEANMRKKASEFGIVIPDGRLTVPQYNKYAEVVKEAIAKAKA